MKADGPFVFGSEPLIGVKLRQVKKGTGLLLLGLIGGVVAVMVYQRVREHQAEHDVDALDEKVSLRLAELEERMSELAS